jgi:beta-glucosidase
MAARIALSQVGIASRFILISLLLALFGGAEVRADEPFLWGVSTAAFQIEGAVDVPEAPAHSDAWEWAHWPGKIKSGENFDVSTDFWHRYDEDFALAQELGANAFRASISWERIEPERGQFNEAAFQHYERMLTAMRARGLEPVVTLFHTAMPLWVSHDGGIAGERFPDDFADYAVEAVRRLSAPPASVRYWLTLNEPATLAEGKYVDGTDPANIYSPSGEPLSQTGDNATFLKAITIQAEAHLEAAARIRALKIPGLKLGVATDWTVIQAGKNPLARLVRFFAKRVYDEGFLRGIVYGTNELCFLGRDLCPKLKHARDGKLPSVDFIGLNYYTRDVVKTRLWPPSVDIGPPTDGPVSESGMPIYPRGMEESLVALWKDFHLPVLVTENGVHDSKDPLDRQRIQFLRDHIAYLDKARNEDHVPVLGYLHWSLTDNFEWPVGYGEKIGLCAIDPVTLNREPRPSFYEYARIIQAH